MRIAILQMTSGIDPAANAETIVKAVAEAKQGGAQILFTPEMAGMLDRNRKRAAPKIAFQDEDLVLRAVQATARENGIYVALGSLPLKQPDDDRWVNRSFLIDASGNVAAQYDKMHMFDVALATGETWRESAAYAPGDKVVTVDDTPLGRLGLAVCYDMRFPALFEALGRAQCDAISVPAAFTVPTGQDHWHVLLRARAIEASAFVIAAAQVGIHEDGRETYGHSLVIDPWGEIVLDMGGEGAGLGFCDLNLGRIDEVRTQLPSLANRRSMPN